MSDYNSTTGVYAPQFGGNKDYVSTCQDCHMKDMTGKGCDKQAAPVRNDLPLHDMTGGNTFIPAILSQLYPSEVDNTALTSGISRANYMLQNAVEMEFDGEPTRLSDDSLEIQVKITNNTGHKLPSGYPEGRRMWINIKAYDTDDNLIFESGEYDSSTGILAKDPQEKVYEIKPGLTEATATATGNTAGPSFHFVLNDTIYKDNRIPPRGFTNSNFAIIQSPPVAYTYAEGQYWDITKYKLHPYTAHYTATLYYQTVSKEYIEFLKDNNTTDSRGTTMYNLWNNNNKSTPVAMKTISATVSDPLPVELISFTAALVNNRVHLSWATGNELNNYGFYIERKVQSGDWEKIGFIQGNGTSNSPKNYSFTDDNLIGGSYFLYRLNQVDNDGTDEYSYTVEVNLTPQNFELSQNYPNPFNPSTKIRFTIPTTSQLRLNVYNMLGEYIRTIASGEYSPGFYEIDFEANDLPSGIYIYKLETTNLSIIKKMLLLK